MKFAKNFALAKWVQIPGPRTKWGPCGPRNLEVGSKDKRYRLELKEGARPLKGTYKDEFLPYFLNILNICGQFLRFWV